MNIEIKKLDPADIIDFIELIKVFEIVFEWENFTAPDTKHLQKLLDNSGFLVFIAKKDYKLVAGLTAYVLDMYDNEKPSAYIYDLAVINELQRKGIGKLLIETINDYCYKNGFNEVFVQAETEDIEAVNFYRKTAISNELKATHFTYTFDNKD